MVNTGAIGHRAFILSKAFGSNMGCPANHPLATATARLYASL